MVWKYVYLLKTQKYYCKIDITITSEKWFSKHTTNHHNHVTLCTERTAHIA